MDTRMKRLRWLTAWLILWFVTACNDRDVAVPPTFTHQQATLRVIACSRGCEQYVLYADGHQSTPLYVTNMPDSLNIRAVPAAYVNNELPVVFSGTRSDELQQISVADASDIPRPAFQAHRIQLMALRRR